MLSRLNLEHVVMNTFGGRISTINKVICRNPSLGFATKAKRVARLRAKRKPGSHITYPWECRKVWGNEPSHSQGNSHFRKWSPGGLPKLQRKILGVKIQWLMAFFTSLERFWNVDVQNRLALLIWTIETQVMAKRRVASLTPGQKKSGIDPIYLSSENVRHIVEKLSTRATTLL
jgi:hypothetical protein